MKDYEKMYIRDQKIYKKYIGQFEKLKKLEIWMFDYHKLITKIAYKGKIEDIKVLDEKLHLGFDYKNFQNWNINITVLDEIFNDFLHHFSVMCRNDYYDFSLMENDKLILYNIIEKYIDTLKECSYKTKRFKKFVKITKSSLDLEFPKSKDGRFFDSSMQRYCRASIYIFLISVGMLILMALTVNPFIDALNEILNTQFMIEFKYFILNFISINNLNVFLTIIAITLLLIIDFFFTISILIITRKFWYPKLPEIEFAFERDIFEKKSYIANLSFIVSLLALISSIIFNFA